MFQQEQARKLQEAKTGISKQMIVSGAIQQNQMMAPQQPMGQTTNPNGWGRTA